MYVFKSTGADLPSGKLTNRHGKSLSFLVNTIKMVHFPASDLLVYRSVYIPVITMSSLFLSDKAPLPGSDSILSYVEVQVGVLLPVIAIVNQPPPGPPTPLRK